MLKSIHQFFKSLNKFEFTLLVSSLLMILIIHLISYNTLISLISSICGILAVMLSIKGKVSNYYFGLIKIITYSFIAYSYSLYTEFYLNILFYLPLQILGLYLWYKNSVKDSIDNEDIIMKKLSVKSLIIVMIISLILIMIYTVIINHFNYNVTGFDGLTIIFAIVGQILMVKRYVDQWLFWTLTNLASILIWILYSMSHDTSNYSIIIMYCVFLINSTYGYFNWLKIYKYQIIK